MYNLKGVETFGLAEGKGFVAIASIVSIGEKDEGDIEDSKGDGYWW